MADIDSLWSAVCKTFPCLFSRNGELLEQESHYAAEEMANLSLLLKQLEMDNLVEDLVIEKIEQEMRLKVSPDFWKDFVIIADPLEGFQRFRDSVTKLDLHYLKFIPTIEKLAAMRKGVLKDRIIYGESDVFQMLKVTLRSILHSQMPSCDRLQIIEQFYRVSFKAFYNSDKSFKDFNESGEDILHCSGCSSLIEGCRCNSIVNEFHETNKILIKLELLERLAGDILTKLIHHQVETHVQDTCKGSFDVSFISTLENWLNNVVVGWLAKLYEFGMDDPKIMVTFDTFKQKLQHLLYETYTKTRIEQLFNIIIEYPDSDPAIVDLRICLEKTDLRRYLTHKLQQALETRLLHPGVNTPDIIIAFSASIRALKQLDPTGVLLETVTKPIRQYLRCREDTVKCVVVSLTEEGPGELAEELVREDTDDSESVDWQNWQPDPIDAQTPKTNKNSWDIISMLINVYGSKEMFVNEYKNLLAERLLNQFTYNTDKEIRYLELLKLRFGDSELHCCDVMLKDIHDSKRISSHLFSDSNFGLSDQPISCTAMILSAQFWPSFKEETLELPVPIKELFSTYTKAYETFKGNRTLNWKPHLGSVNLDIELKGRTINLTVNPAQATIIWYFQEKDTWTIEELSQKLLVTPTLLRRRIAFWQSQGLLREVSVDKFVITEDSGNRVARVIVPSDMCDDDESESVMASAHDQREEELQVSWSYIVGMLTNLDSMTLERIHQMLKMVASHGGGAFSFDCTPLQLKQFLDRKVREHKLIFTTGQYRLQK